MERFFIKIRRWWLFTMRNPVARVGEAGGFKWKFRRFWLEIETLSGNFKARFTAAEHPYGYLMAGEDDQTQGFAERLYMLGQLLTTDQKFVEDIDAAFNDYGKRLEKKPSDEFDNEEAAIEEVRGIQEYVEAPSRQRKKMERDINGRFSKTVKKMEKEK